VRTAQALHLVAASGEPRARAQLVTSEALQAQKRRSRAAAKQPEVRARARTARMHRAR